MNTQDIWQAIYDYHHGHTDRPSAEITSNYMKANALINDALVKAEKYDAMIEAGPVRVEYFEQTARQAGEYRALYALPSQEKCDAQLD